MSKSAGPRLPLEDRPQTDERVYNYVRLNPDCGAPEVAKRLGIAEGVVAESLANLAEKGRLTRRRGRNARWLYRPPGRLNVDPVPASPYKKKE